MGAYLAYAIIDGRMDYKTVITCRLWGKYKTAIDEILTKEGKQDLIVPIG